MLIETCLTESQIIANSGKVIKNQDGTISVFYKNQATGELAPKQLTKPCCEALGIPNAYFDVTRQKCLWSNTVIDTCTYNNVFKLVLNPKGNDGAIFLTNEGETSVLSVDFDYLFKFSCSTLNDLVAGRIKTDCKTVLDVFESLNATMTIDVVENSTTGVNLKTVYETEFFKKIGKGNLYNYLKSGNTNTGFYICGGLTKNQIGNTCYDINLYDLNVDGDTINCATPVNQILSELIKESSLTQQEFKKNIDGNAFGPNWQHFHIDITGDTVLNAIANEKIKLTLKVSGVCIDMCVLVDNIELNKNTTRVTKNDIFVTKSPGFELDRIIDNKKSWVSNSSREQREFYILKSDKTQPIRYTDYYLDDEQQIINTKEIDLDINIASGIETDVWGYIVDNPCILKNVVYSTITLTTYSCPAGFSATPANDSCQKIEISAATFNGSGSTIVAGNKNGTNYGVIGTYFYPEIQNDGALPVYYIGSFSDLRNQTGGTITALNIESSNPFWVSLGSTANGRLNNIGLSAETGQWVGFTKCLNIDKSGTYYVGLAADNYCRFYINGQLIVNFSGNVQDNFRKWSVFPITLNSGKNIIEMYGRNQSSDTAFGAEIYNPIDYATLLSATGTGATQANVIFTTAEFIGKTWELGSTVGYTCPSGFSLDNCNGSYTCSKIENTGITSNVSFIYTSVTTDNQYNCSGATSCGDAPINLDELFTQPLSSVTTVEDFKYYTTSELVDAKDRKIIQSYPTLKLLYERYMDSMPYCNNSSSNFDYFKMDNFANLIGNYWIDLIEQVIPATSIWGATRTYSNTIFDAQKFTYKPYSLFFGDNVFTHLKVLSPASGVSINTSATTSVVLGSSNETMLFFSQGNKKDYSNLYIIQNNSGSEFIGTINIIGPDSTVIGGTFGGTTGGGAGGGTGGGSGGGSGGGGGIGGGGTGGGTSVNECGLSVYITGVDSDYNTNNGSATAVVSGSYGAVEYLWNNNNTTNTITNLTPGVYSVTVKDTSIDGCVKTANVTVAEKACTLSVTTSTVSAVNSGANGSATAIVSGGKPPYTYSWNTTPTQTTSTATNIASGTYTVIVTDAVGCIRTSNATVSETPCNLSIAFTSIQPDYATSNGSITAIVSGGKSPYTYSWDTTPTQTTSTASNIASGTYTVTVTDAAGCIKIQSILLQDKTPIITLGAPTCRTGNCNDNAICSVKYAVNVTNAPTGSYITINKINGFANVYVLNNNPASGVIQYVEPSGLYNVMFDLELRNSSGTIIAYTTYTISHQSFWRYLPVC